MHTLIHKSFVLTDMAEDEAKNTQERTVLYASAIKDMETVINIIPENIKNSLDRYNKGRGYYNLACYKTQYYLLKDKGDITAKKDEILDDLRHACEYDGIFATMAKADPDLRNLTDDENFKKIMKNIVSGLT